jgi:hypothetical protein
MELQSHAQEYAYIDFSITPNPGSVIDATVDFVNWGVLTFDTPQTGKVLLRGPRYTADTQGLLVQKNSTLYARINQAPEAVIRPAGQVVLT